MSETKYGVPLPPQTTVAWNPLDVSVYSTPSPIEIGPGPVVPVLPPVVPVLERMNGIVAAGVSMRLDRIEAKLDELLRRTAPEASVVEEIRRRVNEALDAVKSKG